MALESALSALGQGIRPPLAPQPQGGGIPWEQLLKLLPLLLAGMKGGMPAVGGYATGLAEGERQNQMLGMRQDEMAYGREQDQQQRQRQEAQDQRQAQQDRLAAVDRLQRNQDRMFDRLQGDSGTAVDAAPIDDPNVDPEHWALERTQEAANRLNADPDTVQRVAAQVGLGVSQRKQRKAAEILGNLRGRDPQSYPTQFMGGLTLDDLKALAPEAAAALLPSEPPLQMVEAMSGGQRVRTPIRLREGESVPVPPPDRAPSEPGSWSDTGRVNDKGEAIYINSKTMQTRTAAGVGAKPATQAQTDEQSRKRQVVLDATSRTLDAVDELLDEKGRLRDNIRGAIGGSRVFQVQRVPGTQAYDAQASIDRVKARLVTDLMAELKAQSRTGATGFGQLNLQELKIMQDAAAKLDPGQSEASLEAELRKIRDRLNMIIKEPARTPEASRGGRSALKDRLRGGQ